MMIEMLKSKIHRATVTGADLNYVGSVSICPDLIAAAGLRENEKVDVLNIDNGNRLTTYVMRGSQGEICLNGAAARLIQKGNKVIIVSYAILKEEEAETFHPTIVLVDDQNKISKKL